MPALHICVSTDSLSLAGPMVQIIFLLTIAGEGYLELEKLGMDLKR